MAQPKVFLSPSSQQANIGVVAGYIEEVVCNKIADVAERELLRHGCLVKRNNPANSYAQHTDESNAWGADDHVVIHTNAAGAAANGLRAGCFAPAEPARESTKLTQAIYNRLAPITPSGNDLMVKYGFDEIARTNAKAAYLEVGFHTNLAETQWILDHIEDIGVAIARGILDYHKIAWVAVSAPADWQQQLDNVVTKLTEANRKITYLTGLVATGQAEIAALKNQIGQITLEREQARTDALEWRGVADKYLGELNTIANAGKIIRKYEV